MNNIVLLTRDQFRESVFNRDNHKCVVCGEPGQDAHHIMERRLFPDGGYYLDNGATLCGTCHLRAEETTLSVEEILVHLGLARAILPPHLYDDQDQKYDKWGNPILPPDMRLRGELFDDESVRKVLAPVLYTFVPTVKYPRTYHLPFSPGVQSDDRVMESYAHLQGCQVVVTEKMDGENTTLHKEGCHARSLDYEPHPSRDRVKALWSQIAHDIPEGMRICGENLYATHSIHYDNLYSYFQVFGVWDGLQCLPWNETIEWTELLGLKTVPILYVGEWDEQVVKELVNNLSKNSEGLVVRRADSIHMKEWRYRVGKYVRANHVQTHGHWMRRIVVPNQLANQTLET